jgi:autotransporter family porin
MLVVVALLVAAVTTVIVTVHHSTVSASQLTSGGWTTKAVASPTSAAKGAKVTITATVTSATGASALVDVEVYNASAVKVDQVFWDDQSFSGATAKAFSTSWTIPSTAVAGTETVKIGIFSPGWGTLWHWNNSAATFTVQAPPSTTTTRASTTSTTSPSTTTSTTSTSTTLPSSFHFSTLPPGSALPSDQTCASEVRAAAEVRPGNAQYNATRGTQKGLTGPYPTFARVDGNFTGTTDEILQWVACKWGIDEDVVRAQAAVESWWNQTNLGDWSSDSTTCAPNHPIGSDPSYPGQCPQSVGILQVRYPYWTNGYPQAETSTAYNADYTYAQWRACFEGQEGWLNTVDHTGTYAAGDLWGCIGVWYSGRWYTSAADGYMSKVQGYLSQRVWAQPGF